MSKSNNGIWKALKSGVIKLPHPFEGMRPGRRPIDRRLFQNSPQVVMENGFKQGFLLLVVPMPPIPG